MSTVTSVITAPATTSFDAPSYTTLFRSPEDGDARADRAGRRQPLLHADRAGRRGRRAPRGLPRDPLRHGLRPRGGAGGDRGRSEEHTSELQSHVKLVCRLLLEKKK